MVNSHDSLFSCRRFIVVVIVLVVDNFYLVYPFSCRRLIGMILSLVIDGI